MKKRGFTLVEILVSVSLAALAALLMANSMISTTRFAKNLTNSSSANAEASQSSEMIASDIRASESVLVRYPTAVGTYRSDTTSTVILKIPSGGTSYNVVIYQWEAAAGVKAPGVVKRYTATINGASETTPTLDREVASNVNFGLEYWAIQSDTGNGYTRNWSLATQAIGGASEPAKVLLNGDDVTATGQATVAGSTTSFPTAPPTSGATIVTFFPISVASSPGGQISYSGGVKFSMTAVSEKSNARNTYSNSTISPLMTMVVLRNKLPL